MTARLRRCLFAVPLVVAVAGCNHALEVPNEAADATPLLDMTVPPDFAHGGPTEDPGTISKSGKSAEEAETHVTAAANGYVVVAYIALQQNGGSTNGYRFSTDDGNSWLPADFLASPAGEVASDPVLAADAQSNFYMTWIGFKQGRNGQPTDMHVYVAEAPAGTTRFGAPVEVSEQSGNDAYDKPWITITNDNAVLVTYARTSSGGILAARSTDLKTFSNTVIVEDRNFRNLVFPCHPSTGSRVFAAYHAGGGIGLRWSDDHGATWPNTNKTAAADPMDGPPAFDDPTCAAEGNEVWVSYGLSNDQFGTTQSAKLSNIKIAHSSDGGPTIDHRWDAGDSNAAQYFMHPYLVREFTGALDLVYYAGNSEGDAMGSFRRARSTDNGATWGASIAVKSPITYLGARDSQKWLGDYVGLFWARDNLYMSYVTNNSGVSHVDFFRTAVPN